MQDKVFHSGKVLNVCAIKCNKYSKQMLKNPLIFNSFSTACTGNKLADKL